MVYMRAVKWVAWTAALMADDLVGMKAFELAVVKVASMGNLMAA